MQSPLFNQEGVSEIRKLPGASSGLLLDWLNHGYYAAKPFDEAKPYTLASEWLCADIASLLGLQIPSRQTIDYNGTTWIGFEWRDDSKGFVAGMESQLLNADDLYGLLAFDVLVCNRDRHANNILFQRPSSGVAKYTLQLIDHSHALIGNFPNFAKFKTFHEENPDPDVFLRKVPEQLRGLVVDFSRFDRWIERIEGLSRTQLSDSVSQMPLAWNPNSSDTEGMVDFLEARKPTVRQLLESGIAYFPNIPNQEESS